MIRKSMYIDGGWKPARSGKLRDIINPYDGSTIAQVAEGAREDAIDAIAAARKAFDSGPWPQTTAVERVRLLFRLADLVAQENDDLARLESLDTGKTVTESRWDMDDIAGIFRYFAGLADKDGGEVITLGGGRSAARE